MLLGNLWFVVVQCGSRALQPALLPCALFLLSSPFLIPFERYIVPFLPILIVFGVAGLVGLFHSVTTRPRIRSRRWRAAIVALGLLALCVPNLEAYGVYPQMGRHLDWRDTIHTQEWNGVVAMIATGRIATPNARSLIFYGNLRGVRAYEVIEQFDENPVKFAALTEGAERLDRAAEVSALRPADPDRRRQQALPALRRARSHRHLPEGPTVSSAFG